MNIQIARTNMLKQQLRTNGVLDEALLSIINNTSRELFVPAAYQKMAYADMNIPLSHGQVMLSPTIEAQILQRLAIQPHERVLEIGTGTGYLTALLAQLAHHVTSIDIFPEFIDQATQNLARMSLANITLHAGNGAQGWHKHHPFDVILITGGLPFLPQAFEPQLALGGRLFAVIGTAPAMEAHVMTRSMEQPWSDDILFETTLPMLIDAPQRDVFEF